MYPWSIRDGSVIWLAEGLPLAQKCRCIPVWKCRLLPVGGRHILGRWNFENGLVLSRENYFLRVLIFDMAFDPSQFILYLNEWKVLICLNERCKHALSPDGVALHLRTFHKDIYDLQIRRRITDYTNTLALIHPSEIQIPMNTPSPIEGLGIHQGWKCKTCLEVGPVFDAAHDHCKREHNWKSTNGIHIYIIYWS